MNVVAIEASRDKICQILTELELQEVVSHMGAGNQTQVLQERYTLVTTKSRYLFGTFFLTECRVAHVGIEHSLSVAEVGL